MNNHQKYILIAGAAISVLMLTYPPFYQDFGNEHSRVTLTQYGCLFGSNLIGRVDFWLLLAQWIATGIVGAVAYILLADKKKKP